MALTKRISIIFLWVVFSLFLLFSTSSEGTSPVLAIEGERNGGIIFPDNQGTGGPGETIIYQHTVKNVGQQGPDTFDITADSSENWFASVSPEEVTLNEQEEEDILVTIVVSPNAQEGDVDVTTVTITSQTDPGITDFSTDTTIVPVPIFLPIIANNAGEQTPDCQLVTQPPGNPSGVDLIVTSISLSPNPPQAGQEATVRVTVKNQGVADVITGNNFIIDFYDNPEPEPPGPLQGGDLFWGVQGVDFPAGASQTVVGTYTFTSGFHHLYAQVDTDDTVDESNETNNVYGCLGLAVN